MGVVIMKLSEIITIIIAVYGAILSTINIILQRLDKKRIIDIIPSWGFLYYDNGTISEDGYIFIEVVNNGHVAVTVNTPYIILPNKKTIVFPQASGDVSFPNELMPGRSCKIWVKSNAVMRHLRNEGYSGRVSIKVAAKDATGKQTIGRKKQKINLN